MAADVEAEHVAITAGCNQAFYVAIDRGRQGGRRRDSAKPLVLQSQDDARHAGHRGAALPCRAETGFVPEVEDAEPLIDPRVRAIVLVSPNNPTGAVYPPAMIAAFQELCRRRGIALIVDETYRDFVEFASRPHDLFAAATGGDNADRALLASPSPIAFPAIGLGRSSPVQPLSARSSRSSTTSADLRPAPGAGAGRLGDHGAATTGARPIAPRSIARAAAFRSAIGELERLANRFDRQPISPILSHPFEGCRGTEICEWLARERGVLCLPGSYFGPGQEWHHARRLRQCRHRRPRRRYASASPAFG